MPELKFLNRSEIDEIKWDSCVDSALYNSVYGYSWYLDAITDQNWSAVILEDYKAVFPLPWRKKYGIFYIYQPFFCQQLGIFSSVSDLNTDDFVLAIPKKFKRIHLQLNHYYPHNLKTREHPNYILNLNQSYKELRTNFKQDAIKNLKKSEKKQFQYDENIPVSQVIDIHRNFWGSKEDALSQADYQRFELACKYAKNRNRLLTIAVGDADTILGASIFMQANRRLHYLVSAPTDAGRVYSIMHAIVNYVIEKYSEQDILLDFEGSKIPEVASFYKKWGSTVEQYYEVKINKYSIFNI